MKFKRRKLLFEAGIDDALLHWLQDGKARSFLKEKFGGDFNFKPLCPEVSRAICARAIEEFFPSSKSIESVVVQSLLLTDTLDTSINTKGIVIPITTQGHVVVKYGDLLFDFTIQQFQIASERPEQPVEYMKYIPDKCPVVFQRSGSFNQYVYDLDQDSDYKYLIIEI